MKNISRHSARGIVLSRRQMLAVCGALSVAGAAGGDTHSQMILRHSWKKDSVVADVVEKFSESLSENGVDLIVFSDSIFGDTRRALLDLLSGDIQFLIVTGAVGGELSNLQALSVPFLIRDDEHLQRVYFDMVHNDLSLRVRNPELLVLAPISTGAHVIAGNVPVSSADDLAGMTMQVAAGGVVREVFRSLGVRTATLPWGEMFAALQAGYLDGFEGPLWWFSPVEGRALFRTVTVTRHVYGTSYLLTSRRVFESLNGSMQDSVREASQQIASSSVAISELRDQSLLDELRRMKVEIVEIERSGFRDFARYGSDVLLSESPESWEMLSLIENAAYR